MLRAGPEPVYNKNLNCFNIVNTILFRYTKALTVRGTNFKHVPLLYQNNEKKSFGFDRVRIFRKISNQV